MPIFTYQVRDASGRNDTGTLTANDVDEASGSLRKDGKIIISLQERSSDARAAETPPPQIGRIKRDDVIFLANQLAVMVETGVPLADALDSIVRQMRNADLKAVLKDICEQVKSGVEFSAALSRYPKVFSNLFVSLMRASEASGTMGTMLQRVSEYMRQERDTRKKIKGAMTYPVLMLSFCTLVIVAMLVFVLPRFQKIYDARDVILPLPTRFLLALSSGIALYWPYLLVGFAGAALAACYWFRSGAGRIMVDALRIHLPVIGPMCRKACLARSLRTMATMVSTGVGILEGLTLAAQVSGNHFFSCVWRQVAERVKGGESMSDALFENELIPSTVSQMISAGERSGRLGVVMDRVAQFCEDDLSISVKTVTSVIEPIMIVVMGLIVGGLAIALLLPVFSISNVAAH